VLTPTRVRRTARAAALAIAAALLPLPVAAQTAPVAGFVERPDAETLIMALRLERSILSDSLPAYPIRGGLLVPFGEVCRLLGLAIETDVAHGTATGFFISENRRFFLDANAKRFVVQGREGSFDTGVEVHRDDLYVDTQLIGRWLPLDFTIEYGASLIAVRPREPLPIQRREQREDFAAKSLRAGASTVPAYPPVPNPYQLFDWPILDESLQASYLSGTSGGHESRLQSSTYVAGDFLYHEAAAYALLDSQGGLTDWRATLGRKDPNAGLLGIGAREYSVGHVFDPGLAYVTFPQTAPGFLLSNFPLDRQTQADRNTFRGELPAGWDVELYQNGSLIAFQGSRGDGLYEFQNVPLFFGLNVFRLVFYGPEGQRREETSRFNLADSLAPKGAFYYRAVGTDPKLAGRRGFVETEYGLSRNLSVDASVASADFDDESHRYGRLGLRGFSGPVFATADVIGDIGKGWLARGSLQTRLGPLGVSASYAKLRDFASEVFRPTFGPIDTRAEVRLDATIPKSFLPPIPILLDGQLDRITTGLDVWEILNRVSTGYRSLAVSNLIDWKEYSGTDAPPPFAFGDLLLSEAVRSFVLRGEILYGLRPVTRLTSAALTAERRLPDAWQMNAGVTRSFDPGVTRIAAGVSHFEGPFGAGVSLEVSSPGGFGATVTFNASLARDPHTGRWRVQSRSLSGAGVLSALTFLDANGNGVRDAGERAVEGAGYMTSSGGSTARSNVDGVALLTSLQPYQNVDVGLDTSTLEDPLAQPLKPGVRIVTRPGRVTPLEFPIVIRGEVTGTAYRRRASGSEPASGVEVEVVDGAGNAVAKTRSSYDGFFDIPGLPPGTYLLRVAPSQTERLGLVGPEPRAITIVPSGSILDGLDLVIVDSDPPAPEAKAP
jgi:hypothetical protein